jgi:hypothetical protein
MRMALLYHQSLDWLISTAVLVLKVLGAAPLRIFG